MPNTSQVLRNKTFQNIARKVWEVSWPTAFIMFYEFLIGLTDVYIAGKFGKEAQAAYGFSFQLYFIFIIIAIALSIGTVSVVSRLFTSGKKEEFRTAVSSCIISAAVCGAVFVVVGFFLSKSIIDLVNLPLGVKTLAIPFIRIYSLAFMFDYVLLNSNGILRACGMVRKSLFVMSIVCAMNIALDFVLAFKTPLGMNGIAVSTVISISLGSVMILHFIGKLTSVFRFSLDIVKKVINIGWPSGLLHVFMQIGYLALFLILSLMPKHNVEIMAALTNGLKIESAIFLPAVAFNLGAAVVVGNFLGKKDTKGAFSGGLITAFMGMSIVSVITVAIMLNARHIASFLSDNPVVVKESVRYIYIALIGEPFLAWGIILGGSLNGAGDTRSVMLISFISIWLIRIPLCYILGVSFAIGSVAVWWTMTASVITQSLLISARYLKKKWMIQALDAFDE